ncbi:nuclear transport factor 2 family protein [Mycobacterium vicinigordonae]|uniref:Nuclear transport factor 2 family protein n=2 Tax=Mycobacterium vicinigordonae TaxID=1719132 RepID=A0A7D6E655_9MYCO|nr:nuclear transport factor 2 family protein [Mycobacterium vicinigordonae]
MDICSSVAKAALDAVARRYAAAIDRRDRVALLDVFTPHATMRVERPGRPSGAMTGHRELVRIIDMVSRFPRTVHLIAQGLYIVDGDSAVGEVYCTANHFTADEVGIGRNHVMYIRYLDRYSASGGRWRIAHRTLVVDATEDRPVAIVEPDE